MPTDGPARLRAAPHLDLTVVEGRGVVVVGDRRHEVFSGPEYVTAVHAARDGEAVADVDVARALEELRAEGVLVAGLANGPEAAYWARDGLDGGALDRRLNARTIEVVALGGADPAPASEVITEAGVAVVDADADVVLVLVADYLEEALAETNAQALRTGRPWMLAAPDRAEAWIGPVFTPDRGPCWECLAQRLRLHREIDHYLFHEASRTTPVARHQGVLPSTRRAAAGVLVTQLVRWLALGSSSGADRVLTLDTRTWVSTPHTVVWRPQCPACGVPDASHDAAARPPALVAPGEAPTLAGLRTVAPDDTVERYAHHISPVSGLIPFVAPAGSLRPPFYAFLSGDPGPVVHGAPGWVPGRTTPPGGKGTTESQARASAVCEALERYCGEFTGEEPRRVASLQELGEQAIHPNDCMGFSATQYAGREETNATAESFRTLVPEPFDAAAPIAWSPLWSLTSARERLLPTAYCYYRTPLPGRDVCIADSNGNAAGNTIDEAILQGLLELVERDHAALWWYNRARRPGLDLDAFDDPWLAELRRRFADEGRRFWALDLTADLGIPVVVAAADGPDGAGEVAMGLGAHLDLGAALVRAATELVQLQPVPSGGLGHGRAEVDVSEGSWLRPDPDAPPRAPADSALEPTGDVRGDLDACLGRVQGRGFEVLVLDQTRPDVGLPVVKVVAPGLRHFWPRYAAGRLYDEPVALGWIDAPLMEEELVPVAPIA